MSRRKNYTRFTGASSLVILSSLCVLGPAMADDAKQVGGPDEYPSKPARAVLDHRFETTHIQVRFNKATPIRMRNGVLSDLGTGALGDAPVRAAMANLAGGRWERIHQLDEAQIDQLVGRAEVSAGKPMPDLNNAYYYWLPPGMKAAAAIDILNALAIVEMAEGAPVTAELPTPPDYQANQQYHYPRTFNGTGAFGARLYNGGFGQNVRIADVERSFNPSHADLPPITLLGGTIRDNLGNRNHGTATLGQVFALNNGAGIVGGAYQAQAFFSSAWINDNTNNAAAITNCLGTLTAGDVILIEAQNQGPRFVQPPGCCAENPECDPDCDSQVGYVPVEWDRTTYDAILIATSNGIHVVEAGGNGSQNLNDPIYSQGNGGHHPFTNPATDSGAIIVGAGGSGRPGMSTDRSRLWFSNYGTRVNVQAWGESIRTCGYGDFYLVEGPNQFYTNTFGGTSGASPIVASAVAVFNSVLEARGMPNNPAYARNAMMLYGQPQQDGGGNPATEHIGPRPDLLATFDAILPDQGNNSCYSPIPLTPETTGAYYIDGTNASWFRITYPGYPATATITTCGTNDTGGPDTGINTYLLAEDVCYGDILAQNDDRQCWGGGGVGQDSTIFLTMPEYSNVYLAVMEATAGQAGPFLLRVTFGATNDSCAYPLVVDQNGYYFGSLANLAPEGTSSCVPATAPLPDAWYSYTPCANGTLAVSTCGTNDMGGSHVDQGMDTVISAFSSCGGAELACNDDNNDPALTCGIGDIGLARDSAFSIPVTAGQTYLVRVSHFPGSFADGSFRISFQFSGVNDRCESPLLIIENTTAFDTTCAVTDGYSDLSGPCVGNIYGKDLWWLYTAPRTGPVSVDTCGSSFDTTLAVYALCYTLGPAIACGNDECGLQSRLTFNAVAGEQYRIRVGGNDLSNEYGPGVLHIGPACLADFNRDGISNSVDVSDFINAWFDDQAAGTLIADFNGDGISNSVDVSDFINAYFTDQTTDCAG